MVLLVEYILIGLPCALLQAVPDEVATPTPVIWLQVIEGDLLGVLDGVLDGVLVGVILLVGVIEGVGELVGAGLGLYSLFHGLSSEPDDAQEEITKTKAPSEGVAIDPSAVEGKV